MLMATQSIITIEVRDEKFKEFLSVFNKYREAVKEMAADWKAVSKAANDAAGESIKATKQFCDSFKKETEVLNDIPKKLKKIGEASRDISVVLTRKNMSIEKDMEKINKKTKEHNKDLKDNNKSLEETEKRSGGIKNNFFGISGSFKTILGATGALTAAMQAGRFAYSAVSEATGTRKEAMGLQVSTGALRSAKQNLQTLVEDPAELFSRIATLKQTFEGQAIIKMLSGVSAATPTEELAPILIQKIAEQYKKTPNLTVADAMRWSQIFSPGGLRLLQSTNPEEIEERVKKYREGIPKFESEDKSLADFKIAIDNVTEALVVFRNGLIGGIGKFMADWGKDPALATAEASKGIFNWLFNPPGDAGKAEAEAEDAAEGGPSFISRFMKYWNTPSASAGSGGTLAERQMNPGNLKYAGQAGATAGEGGFARFSSTGAGFRAMARQLQMYTTGESTATHHQRLNTLREIISTYAPKKDRNDVEAYIRAVETQTGYSGNAQFGGQYSLSNPQVLANILAAMANVEANKKLYSPQAVVQIMLNNNTGGDVNMSATAMQNAAGVSGAW